MTHPLLGPLPPGPPGDKPPEPRVFVPPLPLDLEQERRLFALCEPWMFDRKTKRRGLMMVRVRKYLQSIAPKGYKIAVEDFTTKADMDFPRIQIGVLINGAPAQGFVISPRMRDVDRGRKADN